MYEGMKIYIAGSITSTDDYKERFAAAEKRLRDQGAIPMHSACLPQGFSHSEYLYICFSMIDVCDAVYFLDNYSDSQGALREFIYAAGKKKQLLYENIDPAWKLDNAVEDEKKVLEKLMNTNFQAQNMEPISLMLSYEGPPLNPKEIKSTVNSYFRSLKRFIKNRNQAINNF